MPDGLRQVKDVSSVETAVCWSETWKMNHRKMKRPCELLHQNVYNTGDETGTNAMN
jgi:hypothetical protein